MGKYLIKDALGRLWARAITRKHAARLLAQLVARNTGHTFKVEVAQ